MFIPGADENSWIEMTFDYWHIKGTSFSVPLVPKWSYRIKLVYQKKLEAKND